MRTLKSLLLVPTTFSLVSLVTVAGLAACSSDDDGSTDHDTPDGSIDASSRLDSGSTSHTDGSADSTADAGRDASLADGGTLPDAGHADAGDAASDGGGWTVEALPITDILYSVGGTGPNDVYVGGQAGIYHSTGNGTWTKDFQPNGVQLSFSTDGAGHMFASNLFAELATLQPDGTWTQSDTEVCGNAQSRGSNILVIGATLYGAVAGELCVSTVTAPSAAHPYTALGSATALSGTTQVFVAGYSPSGDVTASTTGFVGYYDTAWHTVATNGTVTPLYSVVAVGTSAVAFGEDAVYGSTAHGALTLLGTAGSSDGSFGKAWGASVADTWIISGGSDGTPGVTHVTIDAGGASFEREALPTSAGTLTAIWGTGTGELYIVGANGTILHKK